MTFPDPLATQQIEKHSARRGKLSIGQFFMPKALAAIAVASSFLTCPAVAQETPKVITPPEVMKDPMGLNLLTGKIQEQRPSISIPAAPRLTYSHPSDFMIHRVGQTRTDQAGFGKYTVHYGGERSENFECTVADGCWSRNSDSTLSGGAAGGGFNHESGVNYTFMMKTGDYIAGNIRHTEHYATFVFYPDGERLQFTYTKFDPQSHSSVRVEKVQSNNGYHLDFDYWDEQTGGWGRIKKVAIYADADPLTPLARLDYTFDDSQVTDMAGRTWNCGLVGCGGYVYDGRWGGRDELILPGESAPAISGTLNSTPNNFLAQSVVRDGVGYSYTYSNVDVHWYLSSPKSYRYGSVQVTGPNGYQRTYAMQTLDRGNDADIPIRYYNQYVKSSTDELNRITNYSYVGRGDWGSFLLSGITYPEGNKVEFVYGPAGLITKQTEKAKPGTAIPDLVQEVFYTDAGSAWRPLWYRDALNRQTDYVHNSYGQLTEQTDPADQHGVRRKTFHEYALANGTGSVSRRTVTRTCGWHPTDSTKTTCGVVDDSRIEYEYLGLTNLPTVERRIDPATSEVRETRYTYDSAGRALSIDGPLAGTDDTQYFRYDAVGRKTWEIGGRANGLHIAKRTTYRNSDDKVSSVEMGTLTSPTDTNLVVFERSDTTYDGRRYPIRDVRSANGTTYAITDRSFLDRGLANCTTIRMNFASAPLPTATSACTHSTPGSHGQDRITKNVYDAAGQLVQVRERVGATQNGVSMEIADATYSYTQNGKREYLIDANGNRAQFTYDRYDRLEKWILPSTTRPSAYNDSDQTNALLTAGSVNTGDYELYGYDAVGNRTSLRKRDGSTITYVYDGLNRMIRKYVPERTGLSSNATRDVYYLYDLDGKMTRARFDTTGGDGITNTYNGFDELTSSQINMAGLEPTALNRTLTYRYDAQSRRTELAHAAFGSTPEQKFTYVRDTLGRVTNIFEGTSQVAASQLIQNSFDNRGLIDKMQRSTAGNAFLTDFTFDPIGRLDTLANEASGTANNLTIVNMGYNPASQIFRQTRNNDAYTWSGAVTLSHNYTTNGLNQYTVSASGLGTANYCYDANGNLTADGSSVYLYDVENRLVEKRQQAAGSPCPSATSGYPGALQASLIYDPMGRLFQVTGPTTSHRFLYDGDELVAEYDANGVIARRFVHSDNVDDPVVQYDGAGVGAAYRTFLMPDERGSIVGLFYDNGTSRAKNMYDEYGLPRTTTSGEKITGRFAYTGQAWIPELGMYHYKARIYSPTLGRFLQVDPIGYDDQFNLYAYVADDPINKVDTSGRDAIMLTQKDGSKALIIPVKFKNATTQQKNDMIAAYNSTTVKGGNYKTMVVEAPDGIAGVSNTVELFSGRPAQCGGPNACANAVGGNEVYINANSGHLKDSAAHELPHLAGIEDQYEESQTSTGARKTTPKPGYEGNSMGRLGKRELDSGQMREAEENETTKSCTGSNLGQLKCE